MVVKSKATCYGIYKFMCPWKVLRMPGLLACHYGPKMMQLK